MTKTIDENWIDWEGHAFGFGYGSGEPHTIAALKRFMELAPVDGAYDYAVLESELTPTVAWLLINLLCRSDVDMLEYGTSPRYAWLTARGKALKAYMATKSIDDLVELTCGHDEDYAICYPDTCNCGPNGYEAGKRCPNPFWDCDPWRTR